MPLLISTFAACDQAEIMYAASLGAYRARKNAVRGLSATALDAYRTNQLACWIVESQFEPGVLEFSRFPNSPRHGSHRRRFQNPYCEIADIRHPLTSSDIRRRALSRPRH